MMYRGVYNSMSATQQEAPIVELALRINALDGFELGATLFEPSLGAKTTSQAAVLNGGGGVAARFYRRFASFLASCGIPVLTYDYRGIGRSRPSDLRGFLATTYDWAELDCGGAIQWLRARFQQAELIGLGHSAGPLLFGGAKNVKELNRFVFVCPHTGYYGDYRIAYRLPMALFWHVVMPIVANACGYFPGRKLGLGEDLPLGVALQWATRTTSEFRPEKAFGDSKRGQAMVERFREVVGSTLMISFTDDAYATAAGAQRLLSRFPGLACKGLSLAPESFGLGKIGHFGFFRRTGAALWPIVQSFITGDDLAGNEDSRSVQTT